MYFVASASRPRIEQGDYETSPSIDQSASLVTLLADKIDAQREVCGVRVLAATLRLLYKIVFVCLFGIYRVSSL